MEKRQLRRRRMIKSRKEKEEEERRPNVIYVARIMRITSVRKNCPK